MRFSTILLAATVLVAPCAAHAACGDPADPRSVIQAQVEAYNRHDLDGFLACYADDITITDLSGKRPVTKGIAAMRVAYASVATRPAGYGVDIVQRIVNGPTVVDVERVHGAPAGSPPRPDSVVLYEVRDGKIINMWFPANK